MLEICWIWDISFSESTTLRTMFVEVDDTNIGVSFYPCETTIFCSHALNMLKPMPKFPFLSNESSRSTNVDSLNSYKDLKCTNWSSESTLILSTKRTQLAMDVTMPSVRIISYEFLTKLLPIIQYLPLLTIHYNPWGTYDGTW